MTAHRWVPRGDAPPHGPGCQIPDCCWSLLSAVPDSDPEPESQTAWSAGWCPIHGEVGVSDTGHCGRCLNGGAA